MKSFIHIQSIILLATIGAVIFTINYYRTFPYYKDSVVVEGIGQCLGDQKCSVTIGGKSVIINIPVSVGDTVTEVCVLSRGGVDICRGRWAAYTGVDQPSRKEVLEIMNE